MKKLLNECHKICKLIFENKKATIGLVMLIILALVAIFAPVIAPYGYEEMQTGRNLDTPSWEHLMGTDNYGRDIFSRVVYGTRISFGLSLLIMIISFCFGVPLGLISGYFGGKIDSAINSLANTLLSFPWLLMALTVTAITGPGVHVIIISLGISNAPGLIRLVRSMTLTLRNREFVDAAIVCGESKRDILMRYIFPNTVAPVVVNCTLILSKAILAEASISYLGYGTQPPTPSWGLMLSSSSNFIWTAPHMCIFPGIAIVLLVLAVNFFGDGLRDMLDPKYQGMVNDL